MRVLLLSLLLLLHASAALADFEAGMRAANTRNYAAAVRAWRPLAEAGDARAQYHLGDLYEDGRGVGRDTGAAADRYRQAAEQGHARAQNALAILTVEGRGVERDPVEAYTWFALAARSGNGFARRNLEKLGPMLSEAERAEAELRLQAYLSDAGGD